MVFSNATTKKGIVQDTYFRIFNNTDDHESDYPKLDIARNANNYQADAVTKILQSDHTLEWDDDNQTDLPIKDLDLRANQIDYGIPGSTYLKVSRVEIKDQNGNWKQLQYFSADMVVGRALNAIAAVAGTPRFFRLQANSLFLDVPPNYSSTGGLRIFYQRSEYQFLGDGTDDSVVPGFASQFHKILSAGAALEYCLNAGMRAKVASLERMLYGAPQKSGDRLGGWYSDLQVFYESRNDNKVRAMLAQEDFGQRSLGGGASTTRNSNYPYGF